jgi:Uncharacterized conserved protein (DUF2358)
MRGSSKRIGNALLLLMLASADKAQSYMGPQNHRPHRSSREEWSVKIDTPHSLRCRRISEQHLIVKDVEGGCSSIQGSRDVSLQASSIASVRPGSSWTPVADEAILSPLEAWCLAHLDRWYHQSQAVKCPFFRRRYGDLLDNLEQVMKYTIIRRECWPLMGPPQAWRPAGANKKQQLIKYKNIAIEDLRTHILSDWKPETGKGYYVTGKLTTACYRDDCLFLGPDPDMPIKGLRKYIGVAAHLFDGDASRTTLHSLNVVGNTLEAEWQMKGILRLPWRPSLPTLSGRTVYHIDEDGLIDVHEEFWDISASRAFCFTLFPGLSKHIWKDSNTNQ